MMINHLTSAPMPTTTTTMGAIGAPHVLSSPVRAREGTTQLSEDAPPLIVFVEFFFVGM